jgi:hypothetical protein
MVKVGNWQNEKQSLPPQYFVSLNHVDFESIKKTQIQKKTFFKKGQGRHMPKGVWKYFPSKNYFLFSIIK